MEHKPIYLDGVDVSECKHYEKHTFYDCNETCEDNGAIVCTNCKDNPNCYYKQLQKEKFENLNNRQIVESAENLIYENSELYKNIKEKEQEREELKKQLENSEKWQIESDLQNARYLKALEEIEEIINNILNSCLGRNTVSCKPAHNVCGDLINILDIINKAKDGKNDNN